MERVTRNPDGSYRWSCLIDVDFHRRSAIKGLWGCAVITAFIITMYALMPSSAGMKKEIWIPLLPIAVVLIIALPLLYLQYTAKEPHEQYFMYEDCIFAGYGRGAVCSRFRKTKKAVIAPKYIELIGKFRRNRIYVPQEDMQFVRDFITRRLPENAEIRYI